MTKKDYELIAGVIARCNTADYAVDHVAVAVAKRLALENSAFDKQRFLKACLCSEVTLLANRS